MGYKKKQYLLLGIAAVAAVTAAVVLVSGFSWSEPGLPSAYRRAHMDLQTMRTAVALYTRGFEKPFPPTIGHVAAEDIFNYRILISPSGQYSVDDLQWDEESKTLRGHSDFVYIYYPDSDPDSEKVPEDNLLFYQNPYIFPYFKTNMVTVGGSVHLGVSLEELRGIIRKAVEAGGIQVKVAPEGEKQIEGDEILFEEGS